MNIVFVVVCLISVQAAPVPEEAYEVVRFLGSDDSVSQVVNANATDEFSGSTLPPEKEEDDMFIEESEVDKAKVQEQFMMSEDDTETAPPPLKEEEIPESLKTDTIDAKMIPDFVKGAKVNNAGGVVKDRKFEEAMEKAVPYDSNDFS
ncbi:hypothetical protein L596_017803 [Steinernema carpocapsae]|uniref:Uncharacterized protein n=1 Tax=Steinernema carpocapsae TaxID=34508 RepID=A0A4V6A1U4_STECR|nr:hypothetical protein L596_017803 [Steinernema carpocapsae]